MAWPAVVGAIAGAAGSPSSALQQFALTKYQADRAHGESEWALRQETDLANTAHQREVADLKAAGLNPILSGLGGGGADMASAHPAPVPDFGSIASSHGGSVRTAFDLYNSLRSANSTIRLQDAETQKALADATYRTLEQENIPVARKRMLVDTQVGALDAQLKSLEAKYSKAGLPGAELRGALEGEPAFQAGKVGGSVLKAALAGLLGVYGIRALGGTAKAATVAPYIPSTRR